MSNRYVTIRDGQSYIVTETPATISRSSLLALGNSIRRSHYFLAIGADILIPEVDHISLTSCGNGMRWTAQINSIPIRAHWECDDASGLFTPRFTSPPGNVVMIAKPHVDMQLVLSSMVVHAGGLWGAGVTHLLALDCNREAYRLPLPNTFEDGSLCLGDYTTRDVSFIRTMKNTIGQFLTSAWNSDLIQHAAMERTKALFSFRQSGEVFRHVQVDEWEPHCYRVANEATDEIARFS